MFAARQAGVETGGGLEILAGRQPMGKGGETGTDYDEER